MDASAGFFGKMPATGDFVARRLPSGMRGPLDRWLTACLGGIAPEDWPEDGLRAKLTLAGEDVILALVPSGDRLGRLYPLAAVAPGAEVGRADADAWVEAVLYDLADAAEGLIGPDELADRLSAVPPPVSGANEPATGIWRTGVDPAPATPEGVARLLSSG
jgi:type VI secretion system protein ImpM